MSQVSHTGSFGKFASQWQDRRESNMCETESYIFVTLTLDQKSLQNCIIAKRT